MGDEFLGFSEIFPELQIISPEQFTRVERAREQRSSAYEAKCASAWGVDISLLENGTIPTNHPPRTVPRRNTGRALLSGNVFCGHCGGRIFASTARKSHHTNPNKVSERIPIYKCYNRTQHKGICDGPTTYRAEKVDQVIEKILQSIFAHAREIDEREFIKQQVQGTTVQYLRSSVSQRNGNGIAKQHNGQKSLDLWNCMWYTATKKKVKRNVGKQDADS